MHAVRHGRYSAIVQCRSSTASAAAITTETTDGYAGLVSEQDVRLAASLGVSDDDWTRLGIADGAPSRLVRCGMSKAQTSSATFGHWPTGSSLLHSRIEDPGRRPSYRKGGFGMLSPR